MLVYDYQRQQWVENNQPPVGQYYQQQQQPAPQSGQQPPVPQYQQQPSGTPNPPQPPQQDQKDQRIAELERQLNDLQPFLQDASLMVTAIANNPQLKAQVQQAITGQQPGNPPQPQQQNQPPTQQFQQQLPPQQQQNQPPQQQQQQPGYDPRVDSIDVNTRNDIVNRVEQKYGYNKLDAEKRKQLRQKVEQRLNGWQMSVFTAPVHQLPKLLEDAYLLEDLPTAQQEDRLQAVVDAHQNDMGAFPTMQTQRQQQDTGQLTPEHRQWAQKLGVAEDRVAQNLREMADTGGVMTYKPKQQQQPGYQQQPAPSGTPPPPPPQQPAQGTYPPQPPPQPPPAQPGQPPQQPPT